MVGQRKNVSFPLRLAEVSEKCLLRLAKNVSEKMLAEISEKLLPRKVVVSFFAIVNFF